MRHYAANIKFVTNCNTFGLVAFGIEHFEPSRGYVQPIGLLLAERVENLWVDDFSCAGLIVHSLMIKPAFRRQHLARTLMRKIEDWARCHHVDVLRLPLPMPSKYADALLRLTEHDLGWTVKPGKVILTLSIKPDVEHLLSRLEKAATYQARNAKWTITPFPKQQTQSLKNRVALASEGQLAAPWDPDDDLIKWVPSHNYSRLLLYEGEIIGWLITHFVSQDCLRYAKFWVDPGWEKSGAPLALLADVMRSAHFNKHKDVIPKGCLISHPTNPLLHHWIKKQFMPVCDHWIEVKNLDLVFSNS